MPYQPILLQIARPADACAGQAVLTESCTPSSSLIAMAPGAQQDTCSGCRAACVDHSPPQALMHASVSTAARPGPTPCCMHPHSPRRNLRAIQPALCKHRLWRDPCAGHRVAAPGAPGRRCAARRSCPAGPARRSRGPRPCATCRRCCVSDAGWRAGLPRCAPPRRAQKPGRPRGQTRFLSHM